ncbi:hypothetical protein EJ02DRAFT_514121 [Clathrospora elynae]|uniref:Uncharacterized protein n=1 Tax=Clathrospora elynae TaxID=706981 RepID=A0A6A5SKL7_9PLEO|nr:hypothetical protein EJ02DRAFT_514121 [Clathrospora elynae]
MAPPSYTRATTSSTSRATSTSSKSDDTTTQTSTPEKNRNKKNLKRPSKLTPQARQSINYHQNLHPIKPQNSSKPCPLATLPSELRVYIYTFYYLSRQQQQTSSSCPKPRKTPPILHLCRAMRIEAAYTYYTTTPFTFAVRNLDFGPVTRWMDSLSLEHRGLLSRNSKLTINAIPAIRHTFAYPPPEYLLDGYVVDHWKACQQFGNLYMAVHKKHFVMFCRLASWFLWCDKAGITWGYAFPMLFHSHLLAHKNMVREFLRRDIVGLTEPCVRKAWTKNGDKAGLVKREMLRWLDALNTYYVQLTGCDTDVGAGRQWRERMSAVKGAVESW